MLGCSSRAATRISRREAVGAQGEGELRVQHLERHLAAAPDVARQVDGGHAAAAELALERIAAGERRAQTPAPLITLGKRWTGRIRLGALLLQHRHGAQHPLDLGRREGRREVSAPARGDSPARCSAARCSAISMPSAIVWSLSVSPSPMIARASAERSAPWPTSSTNGLAILRMSIGKRCR